MEKTQSQSVLFWVIISCAVLNTFWYTATHRGWINAPAVLADIISLLLVVVCAICVVILAIRWRESKKHAAEAASLRDRG